MTTYSLQLRQEIARSILNIDLDFEWESFLAARGTMAFKPLDIPLGDLVLPWYRTPTAIDVEHGVEHAKPVTVGEVVEDFAQWREVRPVLGQRVLQYEKSPPEHLLIPTLALPDGKQLILDRCHRSIAAAYTRAVVPITILQFQADLDDVALPDLKHHRGCYKEANTKSSNA